MLFIVLTPELIRHPWQLKQLFKVAGNKGIYETKSKQQSPYIKCMHCPVVSWAIHAVHACMSL